MSEAAGKLTHPAYGQLRPVTPLASVLLDENPGTMTLDGTNSWLLRADPDGGCVVVDPGYLHSDHLSRLAWYGPVDLIILTHHHPDHAESAVSFANRAQAPVRAFDPELCVDAEPLAEDDVVQAAGVQLRVLHTPGHTADSICLLLGDGTGEPDAILTGDTILGRGTTVITELADYLGSLHKLAGLPAGMTGLPGHGPELTDLAVTATEYRDHREQRLQQVRDALAELGEEASARQVVEHVYTDVDPSLWGPAEASVRAQLDYLRTNG
jgi:glyoxylase-like metal-dependent hydrolase (beta-lactamase superfamily II)